MRSWHLSSNALRMRSSWTISRLCSIVCPPTGYTISRMNLRCRLSISRAVHVRYPHLTETYEYNDSVECMNLGHVGPEGKDNFFMEFGMA